MQPHGEARIPSALADEYVKKIKEFKDSSTDVHNAISLNDGKFAFYGSMDRVNRASGKLVVTLI